MPSPDPPGAQPQPGGRSRRAAAAGSAQRRGAVRRAARSGAERAAESGEREPGAAGGNESRSTAADGAGQRLSSRLGKSFPDPVSFYGRAEVPRGTPPGGALPPFPPPSPSPFPTPGAGARGSEAVAGRVPPSLPIAIFSGLGNLPSVSRQSYFIPHDSLF